MELKTDLSGEFSGSYRPENEFTQNPPEDATGSFGEFNCAAGSGGGEYNAACRDMEFSADAALKQADGPNKRDKRRRNLLLQAAAVSLGAVLVMNSFGIDILGGKGQGDGHAYERLRIYNYIASGEPSPYVYEIQTEGTQVEYARHEVVEEEQSPEWEVLTETQWWNEIGDGVRYDLESNTLSLSDGCKLLGIYFHSHHSNESVFNLHIDGHVEIDYMDSLNTGINISGTPGSVLLIPNQSHFSHGINMYGNGALNIGPGITVKVAAHNVAIGIHGTEKSPGIVFDESKTTVSGTVVSGELFDESTNGYYEFMSHPDWTVVDENGEIASYVVFAPK